MLGSAKTNLPLLTLTSWVKGTGPFGQLFSDVKIQYLKVNLELKILYTAVFFFVRPSLGRTQTCEAAPQHSQEYRCDDTSIKYKFTQQTSLTDKSSWATKASLTQPGYSTQFQKQVSWATWLSLTSLQFFSVSLSLQQKIPSAPEHFHYTIFLILERL